MKGGRSKTETKRADSKLSVKRGAPSKKAGKKPAAKKGKVAKDPNKPKRPASAFFVSCDHLFSFLSHENRC
ncbi:unnamed protein product [Camellia sinensis]